MARDVLIVAAMEQELEPIVASCQDALDDHWKVKPVLTGVGKVNAASRMVGFLASNRDFNNVNTAVIIVGLAGAIDPKLKVGDLVISQDTLQHDVDVTVLTDLGLRPGQIPFEEKSLWSADTNLVQLASQIASEQNLNFCHGRILTGDQFIADPAKKHELFQEFQGACADMETAALAQILGRSKFGPRWLALRVISDTADHQAPEDFNKSLKNGMDNLRGLVVELVTHLLNRRIR